MHDCYVDIRGLKALAASRWPDADFTKVILAFPDEVSRASLPDVGESIARAIEREVPRR